MITVQQLTDYLEKYAPTAYQEKYDNAGLLVGEATAEVQGVLICLDVTEDILEEAISRNCNVVIAHHPVIFGGIKKLTGKTYVERCIIKAIRHHIALYAIHTNLDNIKTGVNAEIARRLGLQNIRILAPKIGLLRKLTVFVPHEHHQALLHALSRAGAGHIGNYTDCSFSVAGTGTFRPNEEANPHTGECGKLETVQEMRLEVIFPIHREQSVLKAMRSAHPYEEIAYYLHALENPWQDVGSGMIGELSAPHEETHFLALLAQKMNLTTFKHTALRHKPIQKVALCGGSGSFLLKDAIANQADIYISADFKYHEFFDAERKIIIADIGHYESEIFTNDLLAHRLSEQFPTLKVMTTKTNTNPVRWFGIDKKVVF